MKLIIKELNSRLVGLTHQDSGECKHCEIVLAWAKEHPEYWIPRSH